MFPGSRTKLHMEVVEVDVAIVGGGPAGEYAQVILNVVLAGLAATERLQFDLIVAVASLSELQLSLARIEMMLYHF